MATFFFPQGGHCGEVQLYLNIPWRSQIIMYIYMKLWSIFNYFFSFSDWREEQRFFMNWVVADLQVFMSGSNNRGTVDIKDIMATGKRSQVARLVCEPSLVILSLVTYRILEKDLVLEMFSLHWVGSHLPVAGLWLRFQVAGYMKLVGRELACEKQPFILAPHRSERFARRNLWDSATEIPYWWRICSTNIACFPIDS